MKVLTVEESKLHDSLDLYVIAYDDTFNKKYVIRNGKLSDFREIERLAELGKAVEKAFEDERFFMKELGKLKTGIVFETKTGLLQWYRNQK